jgi:NAD(P)-dependent dehydrogenase (short-subunit alcohol dehydrogenase family)
MKIIVVGGEGTIGSAVVKELSKRHEIIIAGHHRGEINCDITSETSIRKMFEKVGSFDALIATTGKAHFEEFSKMTAEKYQIGLMDKLMGQVNLVLIGREFIEDGGSFTLTTGILGHEPIRGCSSSSMVNNAIEGFVKVAAIEFTRGIRINVVSPTILSEAQDRYGTLFLGYEAIPAQRAAIAYSRSVEGLQTGQVYRVGY